MKCCVLGLLLLFELGVYCQNPEKWPFKFDSLVSIPKEEQVVVYSKQLSGVYDVVKKEFIVSMSKGHIQFLENAGVLLKIEKNNVSLFPFQQPELFNPTSKRAFKSHEYDSHYTDGLEIVSSDWIIVNQFASPIQLDMPLLDQYGEDSIVYSGDYGSYVYPLPLPGNQKSGLFDIKKRKWLIPPRYAGVSRVGKYFLAINHLDEDGQYFATPNSSFVDIYEQQGKKIRFVRKEVVNEWKMDWSDLLKNALDLKTAERLTGTTEWYKLRKDGREKVVRFDHDFDYELEDFFPNVWFDFVVFHPRYRQLLACQAGKILHYVFDEETKEMVLTNTESNYSGITEVEGTIRFHKAKPEYRNEVVLSLEQIGTHLIVHQYTPEYRADFPLATEYGEDSVYITPEGYVMAVYPKPEPGHYLSGVYDWSSKTWLIPQAHRFILPLDNKYLVQSFDLDADGIVKSGNLRQMLFDHHGKLLFNIVETPEMNRDALMKKIFEGASIHFAGMQNVPFEFLMDSDYAQNLIYKLEQNGQQTLVRADFHTGLDLKNIALLKDCSADFVDALFDFDLYNATLPSFQVRYSNTTLKLNLSALLPEGNGYVQDLLETQAGNFELAIYENSSLEPKEGLEQADFLIALLLEEKKPNPNTTYYAFTATNESAKIAAVSEQAFLAFLNTDTYKKHVYTRKGDLLLIQKTPIFQEPDREMIYDYDDEIISIESSFVSGNSGVYRKTQNGWKLITSLFAALDNTAYGYIATENFAKKRIEFWNHFSEYDAIRNDTVNVKLLNTEPGFQLLNGNFEPFVWKGQHRFSVIETFDFGYQIYTESDKSILISPSGQLVSDEHFDQYFLENDKIVGYSPTLFDYDEFGDEVLDNEGRHVLFQVEKRKEFELKP